MSFKQSSDLYPWNEIAMSLILASGTETTAVESASVISNFNCTNSASSANPNIHDNNIENGLSTTYLQHSRSQEDQINPYFNQTFNPWYSASAPFYHHNSDLTAPTHRSSVDISEPINYYVTDNYNSSAYRFYNKHLEPSEGAVCDDQDYPLLEALYPNNSPLRPEPKINEQTIFHDDVQFGNQHQMNGNLNVFNRYEVASKPFEFRKNSNRRIKPKIHKCEVCSEAYTTTTHLQRHFKTKKHLAELKKLKALGSQEFQSFSSD